MGSAPRFPAGEASREMFECAGEGDVSELLDRLLQRARPLREALIALRSAGRVIKLDIVQWITPHDVVSPGISLDAAAVEFLTAIRAAIDVDQYVFASDGAVFDAGGDPLSLRLAVLEFKALLEG